MKLEPDKQISLTRESLEILLNQYGILDFTFDPLSDGIANQSACVCADSKKYVTRIYAQGKKEKDIFLEMDFQEFLKKRGIPIPLVYANRNGEKVTIFKVGGKYWHAVLMEFVEGQSVTVEPSNALIQELATLHARMHLLGIEFSEGEDSEKVFWKDLHDNLAVRVEKTTVGGQEVQDLIRRIKAYVYVLNPDLPCGYNHLDIDFDGNVITEGNRVKGIIDFDDLQYSPLVVCLGYTLWNVLDDGGVDAMKRYLSAYEKIRPLTLLEKEALSHIVLFRNYVMAIIRLLLWERNTPIEDITNIISLERRIPEIFSEVGFWER